MGERVYGLLGRKLGHSWSVPIHEALGCRGYRLIELEPEDLASFLRRADIGGLNVTIPYKRDVMPLCGEIDPAAADIGSVNTIVRGADGVLRGYNTDIDGFIYMAWRAGITLAGKKVVVLGTGGASLTAQAAARRAGAREIAVISRSGPDNYGNLHRHADAEVLVNTTPVGMYPGNGAAPVDLTAFPQCRGVLDVVYNPRRTALLLQAEELGIPCCDGLPMLVAQAKRAEEHFTGRAIPDSENERILSQLRREMGNIVLIGMPGCGKSTVGQLLADLTGREAVDIDQQIALRAGCSIPEIFARGGEAEFRALEREETARAGALTGKILLTGGGAVKTPENYGALRQNGRIYHLLRDLGTLPTDGRPLSQGADLGAMWRQREPLYRRFRDVTMDNSGPAEDTAAAIWRDFCEHSGD
ncbi:shikimate kinase [Dysosmobacter sp.]|uniref:shikimate kinase n=1 Tax=Dysosmobacter sp. TaxID=2591382 RepID=UPI002A93F06C|nr:shikimate kinase [Dysosmobacter sp.]MCI6053966.1 shikimate kinase [Dysosmobacter sp.]MDY5509869.1 shikimate kinase [Dysosmobacter sp.]